MTVRFHLLDAFDEIPPGDRISIIASLEKALPLVLARLPIERVDIVVGYSDPIWIIPAWGIGGYAHGKGRISITVDPDHPRFSDAERGERLASVLAHEMHHLARARGPGFGETLGEVLVTEAVLRSRNRLSCPTIRNRSCRRRAKAICSARAKRSGDERI